jgi:cyclophilin family peptidyl-prolyl cis-trans isomerase/HEAT repeat protein
MRVQILVVLALSVIISPLHAQTAAEKANKRREQLETILRIQDRRTSNDGSLTALLDDADPTIRERAVRAFASIQDTNALPLLIARLQDPDIEVQRSACLAVGQTAMMLSLPARAMIERELIWRRLPDIGTPAELLEAIGKFGSADALSDLIIRYGNSAAEQHTAGLTMAIARFAIRNISSPDAVRYLLRHTYAADASAWQTMYALQRIGATPEVAGELEHLALLRQHHDPLVRMNLAVLLGKAKDTRVTLDPLRRLAEFDPDWRVRVNALKALAGGPVRTDPSTLMIFRRAFYDGESMVAITALSALRTSDLVAADTAGQAAEVFLHMRRLAMNESGNFAWTIQAEAAQTLAALLGTAAFPRGIPTATTPRHLHADLLRALGMTGDPAGLPALTEASRSSDPVRACGAIDGLSALAHRCTWDHTVPGAVRTALLATLASEDVAITGTTAGALTDSVLRDASVVPAMLQALDRQRLPDDLEAMQELIGSLGTLGDSRAILPLMSYLRSPDRTIAVAAAKALGKISGADYLSRLPAAPEAFYTDFDFSFLRAIPEKLHITIETARGNIHAVLEKDAAPFTVMALVKLSEQRGFFRGLTFHRVVPNFVTQGGCPRGDGWGGPGFTLRTEISALQYDEGSIGIASAGKDTEGSQFFITHSPQPHLDGRYTIIGKVTGGMAVVRALQRDDRIFDVKIER